VINFRTPTLLIVVLMIVLNVGAVSAAGGQPSSEEDMPVVFVPSDDVLRLDNVMAFPGQNSVIVPVYFEALPGHSITGFEFELVMPSNGLTYVGYDSIHTDWNSDNLSVYLGGNYIEVQGYDDILPDNAAHNLINLIFDIDAGVDFDSTMNLTFQEDIHFSIDGDDVQYDPIVQDGWIKTIQDSVYVLLDSTVGYSYQAFGDEGSIKDTMYVRMPIYLYANYPCSDYSFQIYYDTTYLSWAGTELSEAYDVNVCEHDSSMGLLTIANIQPVSIPDSMEVLLVKLLFDVKDLHEQYNHDLDFSKLSTLIPLNNPAHPPYIKAAGSNHYADLIPGVNFHEGCVYLPKYRAQFDIVDAHIGSDGRVTVPVLFKPTYWAQYYRTFLVYNVLDLQFEYMDVGDEPLPQDVICVLRDTTHNMHTIEITTVSIHEEEKIPPDEFSELYYLHFRAHDEFMEKLGKTTPIYFSDNHDNISEVRDYFPPEDNPDAHIVRDNSNEPPYFVSDTGYVEVPLALMNVKDNVECQGDFAEVRVMVEWIGKNKFDAIDIIASTEGPLLFEKEMLEGDCNINWDNIDVFDHGQTIRAAGSMNPGDIKEGILCGFLVAGEPTYDITEIKLERVLLSDSYDDYYAACEDGWVEACRGREGKPDPIIVPTLQLSQNCPNPFNAATKINFLTINNGYTSIEIYDILGRKVKRLLSKEMLAGSHSIVWDGTNDNGAIVSSGFYFYVLSADGNKKSKKMILIK